jgi:hypothetical protein
LTQAANEIAERLSSGKKKVAEDHEALEAIEMLDDEADFKELKDGLLEERVRRVLADFHPKAELVATIWIALS